MTHDQKTVQFLNSYFSETDYSIYQLAGDASARRYYRIIHGQNTYVLMSWEPFDASTYPFLDVLNHFAKANVHVPRVEKIGAESGFLLLEDLGDLTVERKFWESNRPESSWSFYQKSLDEIIKIHTTATHLQNPTICKQIMFDTAKFKWELNYAKEHLLEGVLKYKFSEVQTKQFDQALTDVAEKLFKQPQVICHRDYHSRNLMIKRDQVYVIDFQDARLGPIQYDLVSLIKDSYVDISEDYAQKMLNYYFEQTQVLQKISKDEFMHIYELMSVQRCLKACGSFASFMNMRQDKRYLKYLNTTLRKVVKALTHFPDLNIITNTLIDSGALEKNYEQL